MYEVDQNRDAYREGLLARALGRSCDGNPYPEHSREASLWIYGWWLIQDAAEIAPARVLRTQLPASISIRRSDAEFPSSTRRLAHSFHIEADRRGYASFADGIAARRCRVLIVLCGFAHLSALMGQGGLPRRKPARTRSTRWVASRGLHELVLARRPRIRRWHTGVAGERCTRSFKIRMPTARDFLRARWVALAAAIPIPSTRERVPLDPWLVADPRRRGNCAARRIRTRIAELTDCFHIHRSTVDFP